MNTPKKVIALVGTYRKGGVVDTAVDLVLAAARGKGAQTRKVYLMDEDIAFCANCRNCTQEPGASRGKCVLNDDMAGLLDVVSDMDAIVLASPMNFGTVTAVAKRFIERLLPFAYRPWGMAAPRTRKKKKTKRAAIVMAAAAPAVLARPFSGMIKVMKTAVGLMGATKPDVLFIGLAALHEKPRLAPRVKRRAYRIGKRLVG